MISWIVGWSLNFRFAGYAAPIARGWSSFVVKFLELLDIKVPKWMNNFEIVGLKVSFLAPLFVIVCTIVANRGTKASGYFTIFFTLIKLFLLFVIIIVAFCNFEYQPNFEPLIDPKLGVRGIFVASTKLFFAYVGFDLLNVLSEESIEPERSVPKAIQGTQIICLILYCLVSFSTNGVGNLSTAIANGSGDPTTALSDTFS